MPSCRDCFLYNERKPICPWDGKHKTLDNGCFNHFIAKDRRFYELDNETT